MSQRLLYDFEEMLRRSYNIEEEGDGWFRFSKGRGVYQGGVRGGSFRLAQELFDQIDPSAQAHLEKDMKKAGKELVGGCFIEEEGGSVWVVASAPLEKTTQELIKEMFDNCSIASRSRAVKKLETQHRKTITINKPR
jgi:hypothetical protein